jgi:hypothetical protein
MRKFSSNAPRFPAGRRCFAALLGGAAVLLATAAVTAEVGRIPRAAHGPERVVEVLERIEASLIESKYQHVTRVRAKKGEFFFDCSGMAAWVLKRGAPAAHRSIGRPGGHRPLAVHYYRKIAKVPLGKRHGPWLRVPAVGGARPGDVLAWVRPKWFPSKNTGHVAFILSNPLWNEGGVPGYLLEIADSSRYKHENDSRAPDETGFGIGTILIPTDDAGQPTGYGWVGSRSKPNWIVPTDVVIGRPLR